MRESNQWQQQQQQSGTHRAYLVAPTTTGGSSTLLWCHCGHTWCTQLSWPNFCLEDLGPQQEVAADTLGPCAYRITPFHGHTCACRRRRRRDPPRLDRHLPVCLGPSLGTRWSSNKKQSAQCVCAIEVIIAKQADNLINLRLVWRLTHQEVILFYHTLIHTRVCGLFESAGIDGNRTVD